MGTLTGDIRFKQGTQAGLPTGGSGEPLWTTDTKRLYLGDATGNNLIQGAASVLTSGQVPFSDTNGKLDGDSGLIWDDTNKQLQLDTSGSLAGIRIGVDTQLYRSGAGILRSPDHIAADDGLQTIAVAGTPSDGSFLAAVADGTLAVDTTNDKLYFRSGGSWVDSTASSITVEEVDGFPSVSPVSIIRFDQDDGFIVSDDGSGQVTVNFDFTAGSGGGNDTYEAFASADLTLTTTEADVTGASVTLVETGDWLVTGTFVIEATSADEKTVFGRLNVDAVTETPEAQITVRDTISSFTTATYVWLINTASPSTVVKLRALMDTAGGTYKVKADDTTIKAVRIIESSSAIGGSGSAGQIAFWTSANELDSESNLFWDAASNQLRLPATGSSTGILIGGDAQIYRSAANTLTIPDSLRVVGAGTRLTADNATIGGGLSTNAALTVSPQGQITGSSANVATYISNFFNPTVFATDAQTGQVYGNFFFGNGISADVSSTIPLAAAVRIGDPPTAGTNVSITESHSLYVSGGTTRFDDAIFFNTDVKLYRTAPEHIRTDDHFSATDGLQTKTIAGTPTDGGFTATVSDGTIAVDTSTNQFYFRSSGTWHTSAGGTVTGTGTAGRVAYWDASTNITSDATFLWDAANDQLQLTATGSSAGIQIGGDTQLFRGALNRLDLASGDSLNVVSGQILFPTTGSGSGIVLGGDTNLYHTAANHLKTDDHFSAADGIQTKTKAGTPTDSDFVVDADGTLAVDTTNHLLYFRSGAVWRSSSSQWSDSGTYIVPAAGASKDVSIGTTSAPAAGVKLRVSGGDLDVDGNQILSIDYLEMDDTTAPAAPGSGGRVYALNDGKLYYKSPSGTFDLTAGGAGGTVTGSGTAGQVAFWNMATNLSGENNLWWDSSNDRLGIGINSPTARLHIRDGVTTDFRFTASGSTSGYTTTFSMDNTGLKIGHNSAFRDLELQVNSTTYVTLDASQLDIDTGVLVRGGLNMVLTPISQIETLEMEEQSAAPSTSLGFGKIYNLNDGKLYFRAGNNGPTYDLTAGAGGGGGGSMDSWFLAASGTAGSAEISDAETVTISAGTGISSTRSGNVVTITNTDRGASQNIFKNIAVSGQSTVVADSNNDTLTLAAGANVTITTNATTDTITIAATGGGGGDNLGNHTATQNLNMNGNDVINLGTGGFISSGSSTAGTNYYLLLNNGGSEFQANVPSGHTFNISMGGTGEYLFDSTALDMQDNRIHNAYGIAHGTFQATEEYIVFSDGAADTHYNVQSSKGHSFRVNTTEHFVINSTNILVTGSSYLGLGPATLTQPTGNQVRLASKDTTSGTPKGTLHIYAEENVESIGTFTATHKMRVYINGTEYWIQLDAV